MDLGNNHKNDGNYFWEIEALKQFFFPKHVLGSQSTEFVAAAPR